MSTPWLSPTMPVSSASIDAQAAAQVAGEDVGHQAVLGVVGGGDRLLLGVEADDRRDGSEDLLGQQAARGGTWVRTVGR